MSKRDKYNISNELYKIFDNEQFLGNNNDLEYFDKGIFLLKILIVLMNLLILLNNNENIHCDLHPKNIFILQIINKKKKI